MKGMTQMEEFLTRKAKNRIWEIPVLAALGIFIAAGISIVGDDMRGRMTSTDVIADAVVMFLFAFPFFRIVIRRVRVRYARQIARVLERTSGSSISLSDLQREARLRGNMERILQILLDKNFMTCIRPDFGAGKLFLVSAAREVKAQEEMEKTLVVECPGCGARNTVIRGRSSKCQYCDSPLKIHS